MKLLFLERDGKRAERQAGIAETMRAAGWEVDRQPFAKGRAPDYGVLAWAAKHGGLPDATCSWEEHGRSFFDGSMQGYAGWALSVGVAPLHVDLANLDHLRTHVVDVYAPDGRTLADLTWDATPDDGPRWDEADPRFRQYLAGVEDKWARVSRGEGGPYEPPGYVVLWTQASCHLSRLPGPWERIVREIAARIAPLRLVVKCGPIRPRGFEELAGVAGVTLIEQDGRDRLQNARLACRAEYSVIVTSSVVNELVLWGCPIASLGEGRFRDKGLFHEVRSAEEFSPSFRPEIYDAARRRYLNWWLRYSAYGEALPDLYTSTIRLARERLAPAAVAAVAAPAPQIATITAVYVADPPSERATLKCLRAVRREFPDADRIAAVDLAPPEVARQIEALGFRVVTVEGGEPPRMNRLLGAAVASTVAPYVVTVESDVTLAEGAGAAFADLTEALRRDPKLGAVEAVMHLGDGKIAYPSDARTRRPGRPYRTVAGHALVRDRLYPTFCATLFRRADLARVDWERCPALMWCDRQAWEQLHLAAVLAPDVTARHAVKVARRAARARERETETEEHGMHKTSLDEMARLLRVHLGARWDTRLRVLDVGSASVNGAKFPHTYREIMSPAWEYVGCDLAPGENVDVVMPAPYRLPFAPEEFDAVISGQCLEHVRWPWALAQEMARVLRGGGLALWTAPWQWSIHRYPEDCWRILPDGWAALAEWVRLDVVETHVVERDSWLVARRP